jgi:O-antigen ligase
MRSSSNESEGVRHGALIAVLALVPLAILPAVFFYFDVTPKILVLLLGTAAALLFGARGKGPALSAHQRWLHRVLALQAASLLLSTALSSDRALSLAGSNWRRLGLIVQLALLAYTYLLSGLAPHRLLRAIAASGLAVSAYGIAQYSGWDPWLPKESYHISEGVWLIVRPPGTLGHAGYLGVYLVYVAFCGAALALTPEKPLWRRIGIAAASLSTAAVFLSGTRAAILGLLIGALVLAVRARPRVTAKGAGLAALLIVLGAAFYFSPAGLLLRHRVQWHRGDPWGGGRVTLWTDTLRMSTHRLLAGFGPETFSSQFGRFQSAQLARAFPDRYYESPHNIFLDALAGQGLLGLAALASMAALGFWAAWRGERKHPMEAETLGAGFLAALVASQFLAFTLPTALLFYTMLAVLCSPSAPGASQAAARPPKFALAAAALLFTAAAFSLAWSDFWIARTRDSLAQGKWEIAMEEYGHARRGVLFGTAADLWYSRAMAAALQKPLLKPPAAAWQQAFDAALRASQASEERANACYNLAAFYALRNDFSRTEQSLRAAIDWAPRWYKPHWMLAQVLRESGRMAEAEAEAERAVDLNGGQHAEVLQTRNEIRMRASQQR